MRTSSMVAAIVLALVAGACSQSSTDAPGAARLPSDGAAGEAPLYAPIDRTALLFGLPELISGIRLMEAGSADIVLDEAAFARDLIVKPILVAHGLGPGAVSIAQRSDDLEQIPSVATSAVWVDGIAADEFAEFDPSFYLLLTSVTPEQYRWEGEKPSRERATIGEREYWSSDWGRFQVVWYTWGEVLYVVLAENQQLLEATLRQMPTPPASA